MIVKLRRKNSRYPDLTPRNNYVVIGIEADALRLLNDQGRPYLYPARIFEVVDQIESKDWITEYGEDNERCSYSPSLNEALASLKIFLRERKKPSLRFGKSSINALQLRKRRRNLLVKVHY